MRDKGARKEIKELESQVFYIKGHLSQQLTLLNCPVCKHLTLGYPGKHTLTNCDWLCLNCGTGLRHKGLMKYEVY